MMGEQQTGISISQAAMKLGLILGLYQTVKLMLLVIGLNKSAFSLLSLIAAAGVPFVAYHLVKRFRDNFANDFFPFISAWILSMLTFFFATMIFSIAAYAYLNFADNGMLVNTIVEQMEANKSLFTAEAPKEFNDIFDQSLEMVRNMNPLQITKTLISSALLWGNIFSLIISIATARIKPIKRE